MPEVPELIDRMAMAPLEVAVPSPLARCTPPPVCTVLRPAPSSTPPPTPLVPLPTVSEIMPARPVVAAPLPRNSAPLLPDTAVPLLKMSAPLTPEVPELMDRMVTVASAVFMTMAPELCSALEPDTIETKPPA